MLPPRNFFQYEQAHFIAGVQEMPRLRIVRRSHDIAVHHVAKDDRVAALAASGHRLPNEGKCLMTIKSAQLDNSAVQCEAVVREFGVTETDPALIAVDKLRPFQQTHMNRVEISILQVPELDRAQIVEMDGMHRRVRRWLGRGQLLRTLRERVVAVAQLDFQRQRLARRFKMLEMAVDVESRFAAHHIFRLCENVLDERSRHDTQGDLAIDPAEGEVIDLVPEWRNVAPLRRIDVNRQDILAVEIDVRRQVEREWRVATLVFTELLAIDPKR